MNGRAARRSTSSAVPDIAIAVSLVGLVSAFYFFNSMRRFDFFDMSAFMDAGYRVSLGQRIYSDFFYIAGPVHPYMHALFFRVFGFGKLAIQFHVSTVASLVCLACYFIGRKRFGRFAAAVFALIGALCFYGPTSHPWYDANAYLWIVLGVFVVDVVWPGKNAAGGTPAAFFCGLLGALAFMTKSNVGIGGAAALLVAIVADGATVAEIGAFLLGGGAGVVALLVTLDSPRLFFEETLFAYRPQERFLNGSRFVELLQNSILTHLAIVFGFVCSTQPRAKLRARRRDVALGAGLVFSSFFTAWTGSMSVASNFPLAGLIVLILAGIAENESDAIAELRPMEVLSQLFVALYVFVVAAAAAVHTFNVTTWRWNAINDDANYSLKVPNFEKWMCNARYGEVLDRAAQVIIERVPRSDTLLILPNMTVLYGMTHRESFRGVPFIFHVGVQPSPGDLQLRTHENIVTTPPDWILLYDEPIVSYANLDGIVDWLEIRALIDSDYATNWSWGPLRLLRRAGAARPVDS